MNSLTKIIFFKEMKETFRDKRVILGVIVSPLLLTPILMGAIGFFAGKKSIEQQKAILDIGIHAKAAFPELTEFIEANEGLSVTRYSSREEAVEAIKSNRARAVIHVPEGSRETFLENGSAPLEVIYNQANENSANAYGRMQGVLREFDRISRDKRLAEQDLPDSFFSPTNLTHTSIAENEAVVGLVLSIILPYIVVMSGAFGGINTAFDLCAGEKERGTMETLLVSPASRYQIVQGKFLTIFCISVISAICSVIGIGAAMVFGAQVLSAFLGNEFSFSYTALAAIILVVIPLSLLTSAGLLLVSSFARNQKEAQAYIFPFIAIIIFPAMLSFVIGAESPLYTSFIPVLNIALAMKQLLSSAFDLAFFIAALGSSALYAFIAMKLVAALFQRESILFRT